MPRYANVTFNPSLAFAEATRQGSELNNAALALRKAGDLKGAERLDLQAIRVKEAGLGKDHISTAISYNSLGEVYIRMGKLDEAEPYLLRALEVRRVDGPKSDLAGTLDNLAQIYEMRGDLNKAREYRREGPMCCGSYDVSFRLLGDFVSWS